MTWQIGMPVIRGNSDPIVIAFLQIFIEAVGTGSKDDGVIALDDIFIINGRCPTVPTTRKYYNIPIDYRYSGLIVIEYFQPNQLNHPVRISMINARCGHMKENVQKDKIT